jgi:hypothetical protein
MYCNVSKKNGRVTAVIGSPGEDVYFFEVRPRPPNDWVYLGKRVGHDAFIPADTQGYEHIPQEFYMALDKAWGDPNGHAEFPDPFLDDLAVAGA